MLYFGLFFYFYFVLFIFVFYKMAVRLNIE